MKSAHQAWTDAATASHTDPDVQRLLARAAQLRAESRLGEARAEIEKILEGNPNHFDAWHMLGLCEYQSRNFERAVDLLKRCVLLDASSVSAQSDLGIALKALRRYDEALACFDRAIALRPNFANAHYNRANLLSELGHFAEAVAGFDTTTTLDCDHAYAWQNRGNALRQLSRFSDALVSYDRAIAIAPNDAGSWTNRAETLRMEGRLDDALASSERALSINPKIAEIWLIRSSILLMMGKFAEARAHCQRALALKPDYAKALTQLSQLYLQEADAEAAISCLDRLLAIQPNSEAALTSRIFALDFLATEDFASHQTARSLWWDRIGAKIATQRSPQHVHAANPNKRIVLGYVSGDFRQHSASLNFRPVLQHHDRSRFEVICYSCSPAEDQVTASFRKLADRWRDVQPWSDDQLSQCIRTDQVDILIDLSGHTEHNRLRTFAGKPAPIQVTAWGHATGTGVPAIDYLFADPVLIPPEVRPLFAEQIYDLPCVSIIEPPSADLRVLQPPVSSNGYLTFGVVNRISKISNEAIAIWARLLRADRTARLVIKDHGISDVSIRNMLLEKFAAHGIALERLRLIGQTSRERHLAAYGEVDICLDPFPHGGGVSTWEALHMGVPVVTKIGNAVTKRLGGAILSAIGMNDWIATDDDEYVSIARRANPDRLRMLRRELPGMIDTRCGPAVYTRAVEAAYQAMWRKYCDQGPSDQGPSDQASSGQAPSDQGRSDQTPNAAT
jgi:predicted O-linked N-acetylglucosamine transferase (SPINDLY family)